MKKITKALFFLLYVSLIFKTKAQQAPQFTNYTYNLSLINPAYVGSKDHVSFGFLGRSQWLGVKGAPTTISIFFHSPLAKKMGVGFSLLHDKSGPVKETHVYSDFSYNLQISDEEKLAFGIKSGATFQQIGILELNQVNQNDSQFQQESSKIYPNFGAGAFYYNSKFYLSVSMPNLLETLHFEKSNGVITKAREKMHAFFTSGYIFNLKNNYKLKPSVLFKYVSNAPLSVDVSLNLLWQEKVEFGISHRLNDSWSGLINFNLTDMLRLGYAYDYTVSNFSDFNSGSHEFILLYDLENLRENNNRIRFF
ncbi:type IX secretion system membrane protein PorP/SprF [Tenacibaculum sp. IB213877]|uniref:PorP/SprF family type IX secretion system membrane protein n=1 Tax=Tenacibaculum sp. IB213877 TaxID=3097351 RepID=UPI002A5A242C|nr:type IX secretion system membrane protein PorP/SprF [Tenacibaculum sp. IB213877]MDY0781517.1 type IX secretion system membrane protein PorP/SprF [Tenacibaculum sp. IB213877]